MLRVIGNFYSYRSSCKLSAELKEWFKGFDGCVFRSDAHWNRFKTLLQSRIDSVNERNRHNKGVFVVEFGDGHVSIFYKTNKLTPSYTEFRMDMIAVSKCFDPYGDMWFEGEFTVEAEGGDV